MTKTQKIPLNTFQLCKCLHEPFHHDTLILATGCSLIHRGGGVPGLQLRGGRCPHGFPSLLEHQHRAASWVHVSWSGPWYEDQTTAGSLTAFLPHALVQKSQKKVIKCSSNKSLNAFNFYNIATSYENSVKLKIKIHHAGTNIYWNLEYSHRFLLFCVNLSKENTGRNKNGGCVVSRITLAVYQKSHCSVVLSAFRC